MQDHRPWYKMHQEAWGAMLLVSFFAMYPKSVLAGVSIQQGLENALEMASGETAGALSITGVFACAAAAMLGRLSWGMAVTYAASIVGIFSAANIASTLINPTAGPGGDNELERVICDVVNLAMNEVGPPVASAAIIGIACMGMFGRISWGAVMITATGIVIIFAAGDIVQQVTNLTACGAGAGSGSEDGDGEGDSGDEGGGDGEDGGGEDSGSGGSGGSGSSSGFFSSSGSSGLFIE